MLNGKSQIMLSPIQEKHKILFVFNEEIRTVVDTVLEKKYRLDKPKEVFASFSLGKAYKTHEAILFLCQRGYGQDAAILVRSLFDLMITMFYILDDTTDERVYRYFNYDWIIRKKMYDYAVTKPYLVKEIEDRLVSPKAGDDSIEEVTKQAKIAQDKYKYKMGWSDKSIKKMSEEVGRIDAYHTVYFLQSNIVHSAVRVMNDYIKEGENGLTIEVGESENWIEENLVTAFDFFWHTVSQYNNLLKSGFDKQLKDIVVRYKKEVERINKEKD